MQLGDILFTQLPFFIANLTGSASSSSAASSSPSTVPNMAIPDTTYTLPKLPYEYNALEPHISAQIMQLHHSKHHQTYITNLNIAIGNHVKALGTGDISSQISMQQAIKFHGGGHINHSLFWPSLCPASSPAASPSAAPQLSEAIKKHYGSIDGFKGELKTLLLGIQGSGWGWLVKTPKSGLTLTTTKDQDPVGKETGEVVIGVDMWEHAYYLDYWNDKGKYIEAVWSVLNWETAEKRWNGEKVGSVIV